MTDKWHVSFVAQFVFLLQIGEVGFGILLVLCLLVLILDLPKYFKIFEFGYLWPEFLSGSLQVWFGNFVLFQPLWF